MKYNPILVDDAILGYDIRNDAGMSIGKSHENTSPFKGCGPVTLKDAQANARLWAAAPDLLEALEACKVTLEAFLPDAFATIHIVNEAIKKAKL